MNDTPNTDRERFEQFHGQRRSKGAGWRERVFDRMPDGTYADDSVQRHWWTWQNALEAQAAELAKCKTTMIAAAEEIHAHWDAHCDAEGYGPANLQRRLEEGVPAEYGYTAGRFAELIAERDAAKAELARLRAERVTGMDAFVLRLLVAAGHVTQAKVDEAFSIAEKAPQPPAQPAPPNRCKLIQCRSKPRCAMCLEMDAAYPQPAPPSAVERDAVRLDWLMRHVPGRALRPLIGVMAWSGDIDEFRAAIDAAAGKGGT
jgi:hypothetical protein